MTDKNIEDRDIINALNGTSQRRPSSEGILEALQGRSPERQASNDAILEALGHAPKPTAKEGELPLRRRGDDLEAVAIWAAEEAAGTATSALAQALMRADGSKGIYAAESEARTIAKEAYAEAAKASPYEDKRQEAVARVVTKLAEQLTRTLAAESKAPPAGVTKPQAVPGQPLRKRESRSATNSNHIIISYS
jgi:hypothetical protein